ncbi:MAG: phosphatidylcholine/phosphatidylserine synthase [Acidobacteria bacterium]|nr:phosphatidylcholine/phosphatidylserine synthase [Acidobacteriota bacterium]MCW5967070.1 phosphatidylcholine/phosphatidylserine synthase [Blastocatellales bacterium]
MTHGDESSGTNSPPVSPRRGIRRGIYLVPSAFTIGNILCGFYAVIGAVKGFQQLDSPEIAAGFFDNASKAIGIAVLLDGLDGRIARMTNATSEFGVELDSIADVLTFGIAPAVLSYTWIFGALPGTERLAWGVCFFFLICGALRLARFNVTARAPRFTAAGSTPKLDKRSFVGLPIPAAAGVIAAVVHFVPEPLQSYPAETARIFSWGVLGCIGALALLMVSTIRYTSFKNVGPRSNKPFVTLPLLSLLVVGIWFYSQWVLLLIAGLYAGHGPLLKIVGLIARLRPQSAADTAAGEQLKR